MKNGIEAVDKLAGAKNVKLFEKLNVMKRDLLAKKSVLLDAYANIMAIEASTKVQTMETGVIPACAKDLKSYEGTDLAGERPELYGRLAKQAATLIDVLGETRSASETMPGQQPSLVLIFLSRICKW